MSYAGWMCVLGLMLIDVIKKYIYFTLWPKHIINLSLMAVAFTWQVGSTFVPLCMLNIFLKRRLTPNGRPILPDRKVYLFSSHILATSIGFWPDLIKIELYLTKLILSLSLHTQWEMSTVGLIWPVEMREYDACVLCICVCILLFDA